MSESPNKHLVGVLLFLACFAASIYLTPMAYYYRGKLEAHWDLAHGNYRARRCVYDCIVAKPTEELERRIFKYAKIRIEVTEHCGYRLQGYNEVQWSRIERLYPSAYDRTLNEVIEWERNGRPTIKE